MGFLFTCSIYRYKYSCMILSSAVPFVLICPGINVLSIHLLSLASMTLDIVVCAVYCPITATINTSSQFSVLYIFFPFSPFSLLYLSYCLLCVSVCITSLLVSWNLFAFHSLYFPCICVACASLSPIQFLC